MERICRCREEAVLKRKQYVGGERKRLRERRTGEEAGVGILTFGWGGCGSSQVFLFPKRGVVEVLTGGDNSRLFFIVEETWRDTGGECAREPGLSHMMDGESVMMVWKKGK